MTRITLQCDVASVTIWFPAEILFKGKAPTEW